MGFEDVESIFIDNKEVQSIVVKDNGGILFKKREVEPLIFTFTGTTLTQYSSGSFSGTNMTIDYGDGTIEPTTGKFGHTYEQNGIYEVKIYGVTKLGTNCFRDCTGLISIIIPNTVTEIGTTCFSNCTGLTSVNISSSVKYMRTYCFRECSNLISIQLNWNDTNEVLTYSDWVTRVNSNLKYRIPAGTKQLYIDKGYPSDRLIEV